MTKMFRPRNGGRARKGPSVTISITWTLHHFRDNTEHPVFTLVLKPYESNPWVGCYGTSPCTRGLKSNFSYFPPPIQSPSVAMLWRPPPPIIIRSVFYGAWNTARKEEKSTKLGGGGSPPDWGSTIASSHSMHVFLLCYYSRTSYTRHYSGWEYCSLNHIIKRGGKAQRIWNVSKSTMFARLSFSMFIIIIIIITHLGNHFSTH